jgi:hypothetical protein
MSFSVDMLEIEDLEKELEVFKKRALPFATRSTLTTAAWRGRAEQQELIGRKLVERNKWTRGSISAEPAKSLVIRKQQSAFGSTEKYMVRTEEGGTERGKAGKALAIPTGYSAGQENARPRTKLPRKPHKMRNIRLTKAKTRGRSRKQRNFLLVRDAKARNIKYIFMDLGRRKGVFRVLGSKRKPKLKMVADVSQKAIRIPPTPTLKPAFKKVSRELDDIYRRKLLEQIRRHGIF